jgi:hypothetical protein
LPTSIAFSAITYCQIAIAYSAIIDCQIAIAFSAIPDRQIAIALFSNERATNCHRLVSDKNSAKLAAIT